MMRYRISRVIGRVVRKWYDKALLPTMLACSAAFVDPSEAISRLSCIWEDAGKTCLTGRQTPKRNCLLSVIVPAYNVEQYIDSCLESILRQQVSFEYEIIVVNDGSTDGTAAHLYKYRQNKQMTVIDQENRGLSAARNTGLDHANGEYIYFVDSDDELPENALEPLMNTALQNNARMVVGSYVKMRRDGSVKQATQLADKKVTVGSLPGYAWGKLIHFSVFEKLSFPEGYWFEDSVMHQIVHPLCMDSTYTSSCISYKYYVNEDGITATANGKPRSIDSLWITMRLLEERKQFNLPYTKETYEYFLSMVRLTYGRTKHLGPEVVRCIYVVQQMLLNQYYAEYQVDPTSSKFRIQQSLRSNNFRKYIFACEGKI